MKLEPANIACPVCGNSNYMRHLIGNNIGYYDTKCLNCLSYFNYEEIAAEALDGKDINVTTNADRIRAMTDEELVHQFTRHDTFFCPVAKEDTDTCRGNWSCEDCFGKWLKQESE